jgi:hypothetical protein
MKVWATLMLVTSGLFSGGVTVIAWERIPVWRAQPLPQFRSDFATTIRIADRVQPALLLASIVAAVGFGIAENGAARTFAFVGAAGFIVTLGASGAVLVPLQRRIIASSGEDASALEAMRRRWLLGHLGRSVLAVASFLVVAIAATV